MNYDEPRQRESDRRWDYTSMNDRVIHPIGYCHAYNPPSPDDWLYQTSKDYWDDLAQHKDKFHIDGHATPEEASDCYRQYLLDNRLDFNRRMDVYRPCQIYCALTNLHVYVDGWSKAILCVQHQNRESVEALWPAGVVIQSMHS